LLFNTDIIQVQSVDGYCTRASHHRDCI